VTVEVDGGGGIVPTLYVRGHGGVAEHELAPHPLRKYDTEPYRRELAARLRELLRG
jgi:hypothetical protein